MCNIISICMLFRVFGEVVIKLIIFCLYVVSIGLFFVLCDV